MTPAMPVLDPWQTTFFFNIRANFKTGFNGDPDVTVSVPLGKTLPSDEALRAATATATATMTEGIRKAIDVAIASNNAREIPFLGANDWKTVWGPQVFCVGPQTILVPDSDTPDGDYSAAFNATNAMYVVHSAQCDRYIVAIAATNTPSIFDWVVEDCDTSRVVAWNKAMRVWNDGIPASAATAMIAAANTTTAAQSDPYISHATFAGITILLSLTDTVITHKTLVDFLKELTPGAGTTITFTGHSLAGALSPTLAMACFDSDAGLLKDSAWRISNAMVYPTAGATPGNGPFANLFNGAGWGGVDGEKKLLWQVWNRNLYNNLDIVPHAWEKKMMNLIPTFYAKYYPLLDKDGSRARISGLITAGRSIAEIGESVAGAYAPINNQELNSNKKDDIDAEFLYYYNVTGKEKPVPLTTSQASDWEKILNPTNKTKIPWIEHMPLQHTISYGSLLGFPESVIQMIKDNTKA